MNQLIKANINEMSFEEIQMLQTQIMNRQMLLVQNRIEELQNSFNRAEIERKQELERIKNEAHTQLELERKRHRIEEHRYGFVSLGDLGQCYRVSIGSVTMGKLLRMVGMAKEKQSKTEPYRECISSGCSKSDTYGDNVTYKWNPEKCIPKIDKWLETEGLIDEFYSFDEEKKLHKFITELAEKYLR